ADPGRLPDSPRSESALRETPSSVLDSPPFKKREFFNRGGRLGERKSASLSDGGESDSGCSSHNEGRHDPPPEADYGWDCPSGLSLLLELMTQSPQRSMGRDSTAENMGLVEVARSTAQGTMVVSGKHHEQTLEPIDEVSMVKLDKESDTRVIEMRTNGLAHSNVFMSPTDYTKSNNQHSPNTVTTAKDLSRSNDINKFCFEDFNHTASYKPGAAKSAYETIRGANALYDLSASSVLRGAPFTQRKIDFEERSFYAAQHIDN
ncbi:hypothetical protein EGW08_013619, partial [Elysia chlorotica]